MVRMNRSNYETAVGRATLHQLTGITAGGACAANRLLWLREARLWESLATTF
jgi:hypothetical protein